MRFLSSQHQQPVFLDSLYTITLNWCMHDTFTRTTSLVVRVLFHYHDTVAPSRLGTVIPWCVAGLYHDRIFFFFLYVSFLFFTSFPFQQIVRSWVLWRMLPVISQKNSLMFTMLLMASQTHVRARRFRDSWFAFCVHQGIILFLLSAAVFFYCRSSSLKRAPEVSIQISTPLSASSIPWVFKLIKGSSTACLWIVLSCLTFDPSQKT